MWNPNDNTLKNNNSWRIMMFVSLVAIVVLLIVVVILNKNNHKQIDEIKSKVVENPFQNITLTAKSAIVMDMKTGEVIYGKDTETAYPLASLTKLMTALTAVELVPNYTTVTITKDIIAEEGDSGLLINENWKLKDLLSLSLISSSNDGAKAIASVAGAVLGTNKNSVDTNQTPESARDRFIMEMNKKAYQIGLTKTRFKNESGLDDTFDAESGAYGSVHDIATLLSYIEKNHVELLEPTKYSERTFESLSNISHVAKNTNTVINQIPTVLASKTGFTELAGGNLAVIVDPGMEGPYVISVLGSTYDARFTDIETLAKAVVSYTINNKK